MGAFYLQHPVHGIHVATTVEEVANCKAGGWSDWALGEPDPVLHPRQPIAEFKVKSAESEVEVLKAQIAALTAQFAALAPKPEAPPAKADPKAKVVPPAPDFLDVLKPQG